MNLKLQTGYCLAKRGEGDFSQGKKNVTVGRAREEFHVCFRVGGNTTHYQQRPG